MRNVILTVVAVAGLAAGASVFAQASNYDNATQAGTRPADTPPGTLYGPSGTLEYWQGNRGWVPEQRYGYNAYPDGYSRHGYANGYPPAVAAPAWQQQPHRPNSRDWQANRRDRDGDGVPDNRDRQPNDPSRR